MLMCTRMCIEIHGNLEKLQKVGGKIFHIPHHREAIEL